MAVFGLMREMSVKNSNLLLYILTDGQGQRPRMSKAFLCNSSKVSQGWDRDKLDKCPSVPHRDKLGDFRECP